MGGTTTLAATWTDPGHTGPRGAVYTARPQQARPGQEAGQGPARRQTCTHRPPPGPGGPPSNAQARRPHSLRLPAPPARRCSPAWPPLTLRPLLTHAPRHFRQPGRTPGGTGWGLGLKARPRSPWRRTSGDGWDTGALEGPARMVIHVGRVSRDRAVTRVTVGDRPKARRPDGTIGVRGGDRPAAGRAWLWDAPQPPSPRPDLTAGPMPQGRPRASPRDELAAQPPTH